MQWDQFQWISLFYDNTNRQIKLQSTGNTKCIYEQMQLCNHTIQVDVIENANKISATLQY